MDYIRSPLNYTGGKYKLLPQIMPLIPNNIDTFVDLFGGAFNVGININCNKIIYNEIVENITDLFENLYKIDYDVIINNIENIIKDYNDVTTKEEFLRLREDYNKDKSWDKLLVLSHFSFNQTVRFNNNGDFNNPSGLKRKRNFISLKERIYTLKENLLNKTVEFHSKSFKDLDLSKLTKNDFIYIDPPYLITNANYNKYWNKQEEIELLNIIDKLNERGIRFALSNVLYHRDLSNDILIKWSKKYNINYLKISYNNSWYSNKNNGVKENKTVEVLITNYNI